ncbi:DctP family TRAP transporter solute-binding subunit [Pseudomonas sp. PDM16]|uniref:DctP family TRAP transporter solute-binding subunit n=1 Tax=Pseudomonas sp. PDM16 TaxID=2769292 RepID=UPI00177D54C8|nr:DctP family TRAP transporter solute-binding subunit [Pseudomonas sp. PDM16]MBD9415668.1 DctP family TRAP transporter solute-binding subunit [Pseudomonas sp. PDM16]
MKYLSALCLSFAMLFSMPVHAEPILIKFSHVVAEDTPKGRGALLFQRLVAERMGDAVKVEVYPNSTLFGDADEMAALKRGEVQMLAPSVSKFESYTKQLQVFDLPFLFDDLEAVKRFQRREKSRQLLRSMASHDIYGLAFWNNGMKQLSANRELRAPADAKGLAFRIQASSVLESQFAALGAQAKRIPFGESLKALQAGTVQGTENAWSNMTAAGFDQAQPFITETNHGSLNYMLISSSSFWQSIPYATRTELESIVEEVTAQVNKDAEQLNRQGREQLAAAGKAHLIGLSKEERAAWRVAMQPLWKQYEAEIGADVLRAAQTVNRR